MKFVYTTLISVVICILPIFSQVAFTVTNTNDSGFGSLREAMLDADSAMGVDTIRFNIPSGGLVTIQPLNPLPPITDPVVIDGFTQPLAIPNTNPINMACNAVYTIQLDGSLAPSTNGLDIVSNSCIIRGLVISNFLGSGIVLTNADSCHIEGNYIGLDASGLVENGNNAEGILIVDGSNNMIGGRNPEQRNIISGNVSDGIDIEGGISSNNIVRGNFIGLDKTGTASIGNDDDGIEIESPANVIGDTLSEGRNIISGNGDRGIQVQDSLAVNNRIIGNLIGTDITGTFTVGNVGKGVQIRFAKNNMVGGTTPQEANVISGNYDGIEILAPVSTGNIIQGNLIGTDITGTVVLGNTEEGIELDNAAQVIIGGEVVGAGNIIAGSGAYGITIKHPGASGNIVIGNFIGVDRIGSTALPNYGHGIFLDDLTFGNRIGGPSGNIIANNTGDGICLSSTASTENLFSANSIFSNHGLGIDLNDDSVTVNDLGDGDTGPNNLQNYPVLTSALTSNGNIEIQGTLNSNPNMDFSIEFFSNADSDTSDYGEGESYIGSTAVTTDANGDANFTVNYQVQIPAGQFITATASDSNGNTSEFSRSIEVQSTSGISDDMAEIPDQFILLQNYPNPFNPSTVIRYQLATSTDVELTVYNLLGQRVRTLVNSRKPAGTHQVEWNGKDDDDQKVPSGIYWYQLKTSTSSQVRKMVFLR